MTEVEELKAILRDELMDDYDFDELAAALIARGVRVDSRNEETPNKILFSSYARKSILDALVSRCVCCCSDGTVEDILKLVPYALNVIQAADFEIVNPDIIESPFVEFGEDLARAVSRQVLSECGLGMREPLEARVFV